MEKRLKWAGHVERMAEDRLRKRADAYVEEGGRGGRLRLRWEDYVKRRQECRSQEWKETGGEKRTTEENGGKHFRRRLRNCSHPLMPDKGCTR